MPPDYELFGAVRHNLQILLPEVAIGAGGVWRGKPHCGTIRVAISTHQVQDFYVYRHRWWCDEGEPTGLAAPAYQRVGDSIEMSTTRSEPAVTAGLIIGMLAQASFEDCFPALPFFDRPSPDQAQGTLDKFKRYGKETSTRKRVKYEIARTLELGHGLIGIDISKIKNQFGATDATGVNPLPEACTRYAWNRDSGRENLDNCR